MVDTEEGGQCPRVSELSAKLEQDRLLTQRSLQKIDKIKEIQKRHKKIETDQLGEITKQPGRENLLNVQENEGNMPQINFKVKDGYRVEKGFELSLAGKLNTNIDVQNLDSTLRSHTVGPPGTAPQTLENRRNSLVLEGNNPSWSKDSIDYSVHDTNVN